MCPAEGPLSVNWFCLSYLSSHFGVVPQDMGRLSRVSLLQFGLAGVIRDQLTQGVEVLIAGQIVADDVVGLPASEQGETRPDLHLH